MIQRQRHYFVIIFLIFVFLRASFVTSICDVDPNRNNAAQLIKKVSTKLTAEIFMEILSSGSGLSSISCQQRELDKMMKDFNHCVHHVQQQLQCGQHGGVCEWVQEFLKICTGQILGRCWSREMIELIKRKQYAAISGSKLLREQNCQTSSKNLVSLVVVRKPVGGGPRKRQKSWLYNGLGSHILRLG